MHTPRRIAAPTRLVLVSATALALATVAPTATWAQPAPVPAGERLRDIVADGYAEGSILIGATTGSWAFGETQGLVMDREFSYVTPENDFKQSVVRADPDTWNWSRADPWLEHIVENGQVLRMHAPIGPQCATWVKDDARTPEELETELRLFMSTLVARYSGEPGIAYLDVVNETVLDDGTWFGPKEGTDQWENPWLIIGQDTDPNETPLYILYAFEEAQAISPDIKLIINQHTAPSSYAAWDKIKDLVGYLRDHDMRVDGIGWQAHVDTGWETPEHLADLADLIDWAHANDLEFHITEASVWNKEDCRSQVARLAQARTYQAILDVVLEKRHTGMVGWNTWGISDATGWKPEYCPYLFDYHYLAKPAYYAVQWTLEANRDKPARP